MITRCPSCHTHFRVRTEQLAARAGQVRCGRCGRAFDALEHLVAEHASALEPAADSSAAEQADAMARHSVQESMPAPARAAAPPRSPAVGAGLAQDPGPAASAKVNAALPEFTPLSPALAESAIVADTGAFDFGPRAAADAATRARRWPWLLGALLLLTLLLAQAAYYYRSTLIVLFPQAKPYAAALCANLGCDLPLPRRIEMISIEASDLQADTTNPNIMVLSATLKNRAIFEQQLPSLELTLTDAQEQPLVRRVLTPRDYIGKSVNAAARFAANGEIAIKVFIEGAQIKATGYRLYLFYP